MLRAGELARIRATNAGWLNQTAASITRPDGGQTSDGFPDATPTTVASAVPCRCEPAAKGGGSENGSAAGVAAMESWDVIFGHGVAALKPMDTITVTGVGVFEVQSVTTGRGVNTNVVASCVRMESAA